MIPYFHLKSKHEVLVKAICPPKRATFAHAYEFIRLYYFLLSAEGGSRGGFRAPWGRRVTK